MLRFISSFSIIAVCWITGVSCLFSENDLSFTTSTTEQVIENQYIIAFKKFSFMEQATFHRGKRKAKGFRLIRKIRSQNIAVAKFDSIEAFDAFQKSQAGKITSFEPGKERKIVVIP